MNPAPIFLLLEGEITGPHQASDVLDKIGENEISQETLSCIEGMPAWRTISETVLWSYAKLLNLLPSAPDWIQKISARKIQVQDLSRDIRIELERATKVEDWSVSDYIQPVLQVNAYLAEKYHQFQKRDQDWDLDSMEFYPVARLAPFTKLKFARNWEADWEKVGGKIYNGEMLARKDDPVWAAISDFGYPFPPFSFDDSMWMESISSNDATKSGLNIGSVPMRLPKLKPLRIVGL